MSWFTRKPPPAPDRQLEGDQPAARYGTTLREDARVVEAMNRKRTTETLTPTLPSPATTMALPLVREVQAPPEDWYAETFAVHNDGTVVQVLGRAPHRQTFVVSNQSGNGVPVYLFRSREDASRFVNATVKPTEGRFIVVPDDPANPRKGEHSGGLWAAVHPTAANGAVIDVTASVYRGPRS